MGHEQQWGVLLWDMNNSRGVLLWDMNNSGGGGCYYGT